MDNTENMKLHQRMFITLLVITMTSCNIDKKADINEEEAKIKMVFPNWVKRFMETRNPDDYFEGVTDDFVIMGCGFEPLTSIDSMKLEVKKLLDSNINIGIEDCQTNEIIIRDDIAIHRYSCFEVLTSKGDTTRKKVGFNFLDILEKTENNNWRIRWHMATEKPTDN